MQVFGNCGSAPVRKESKTTRKGYYEFRLCESQRGGGANDEGTWYSVRSMKDVDPGLVKGDFVKVTGKLKVDYFFSKTGAPSGSLLIIAFEASKIAKPPANAVPDDKCETAKPVPAAAQAVSNMIEWQD